MINIKMQTRNVSSYSPKIAVIGVGGGGGNAVNNMIKSGLECEFLVCNTDQQALDNSVCDHKIQLGQHVTGGLGAGSKPEIGKAAAEESLEDVMKIVEGTNMVFVTAGMGGGTGTGAAPIIARACRERGILTVGVVTKPFHFEGTHRMRMAEKGIEDMQQYVDTLIVIPNQNLFRVANEKTTFAEAFCMADSVLQSGVRGVTDLMLRPGLVNLDFADIRTAMMEMGKAMMGTGEATGERRAVEAAEAAINNPLLDDVSMKGAHGVIINVTGGYDMTLFEIDEACNRIRDDVDPDANIIFGSSFDEAMEGKMRVSILATGIEKEVAQTAKTTGGYEKTVARPVQPVRTAPAQISVSTSVPQMPVYAPVPQRAAPSAPSAYAPQDPEHDMFEQREFAAVTSSDPMTTGAVPQNTALRGTRYKDSFIPPLPAQNEMEPMDLRAGMQPYHQNTAGTSAGLQLDPPKIPTLQRKRAPSLFERITGNVSQRIDSFIGDGSQQEEQGARVETQADAYPVVCSRPSQGNLNIDSPSAPKDKTDLDIPAFLRRQAN
ncbi:MAG: cell division protein FtsZ [Alphaproteobacteria bacterium]